MTAIYSKATSEERTAILQDGLLQLATLVNPKTATEWVTVRKDADRLMRLWGVKESDPAATEMATQLLEMISDFTAGLGADDVALLIEEKETPVEPPPIPVIATPATAPAPALFYSPVVFPADAAAVAAAAAVPSATPNIKVVVIEEHPATPVGPHDVEAQEADEIESNSNVENDEEPSGCLAVATLDNIEDEEEDEDDDDNDGVEVQKMFYKGRSYWLGSDNKIYACADDDEIGDEIGDFNPTDKKPKFY